ncbi:5-methylcytosine-specific restriction protein A [Pacificitalea manganoxidans]|nr:5-methylcytosine-specific restriction protein A [Pacificitalea manganoxidans]
MRKPLDERGNELDSNFSIKVRPDAFDVFMESQGGSTGGQPPRNTDYAKALAQHLARLAEHNLTLLEVQVASAPAEKMPEEDRIIEPSGYRFPLALSGVHDFNDLRLALGREVAAFNNMRGPGGNPTKRICLRVQWPGASSTSEKELTNILVGQPPVEAPTADPNELQKRIDRALARRRSSSSGRNAPPAGQVNVPKVPGTPRFIRDPEVIAWALEEADGRCALCRNPAPFKRADGEPFLEVHHVRPLGGWA